jgi:cell division protease FtsH
MSEKLGPLRYEDNQEEVFLGHSVARSQNISDATAKLIDEEIRRFVDEAEALAMEVLSDKEEGLHAISKALLEYETLSGEEVRTILDGGDIERGSQSESPKDSGRKSSIPRSGKSRGGAPDMGSPEPQPEG